MEVRWNSASPYQFAILKEKVMTYSSIQPIHPNAVLAPQGVLGNVVSGLAHLLPFEAHPGVAVAGVAPHPLASALADAAHEAIAKAAAHLGVPQALAESAATSARALIHNLPIPDGAGHTPGNFGRLLEHAAPYIEAVTKVATGSAAAATLAGELTRTGSRFVPFSAQPEAVLAPQGIFGSLVSTFAPTLGRTIGGLVGHPNAGAQIGNIASHVGGLLPFSAQPQFIAPVTAAAPGLPVVHQGALEPQGIFGSLVSTLAPTLGRTIGGLVGHPNVGTQIGNITGHVGSLLPFSAQPQFLAPAAQQAAFEPQGIFGSLVGAVAPTLGRTIGGLVGHPNVGGQIGSFIGQAGGLIPFSAQPQPVWQ
jgi:hypothetical protein